MKKTFLLIISLIAFNSHAQVSKFEEKTNSYLIEFLKKKKYSDDFGLNPLLVIDGKPILNENISKFSNLKPENIVDVNSISKTSGTGQAIWGDNAIDGVVMIKTNLVNYAESQDAQNSKVLFILDNKIITREQAYSIDAGKDILTATVYKNSNKFLLFNNEEFDGIIVLVSKPK